MPEEEKVPLAFFNLEGKTQLWYQLPKDETLIITWEDFKQGFYRGTSQSNFKISLVILLNYNRLVV